MIFSDKLLESLKNPDFFRLQFPNRCRQRQPGGPIQESWSYLYMYLMKNPWRWVQDMSDSSWTPSLMLLLLYPWTHCSKCTMERRLKPFRVLHVLTSTVMFVGHVWHQQKSWHVWDHQVNDVDVDEGVQEWSDMSGTHLNGFPINTCIC